METKEIRWVSRYSDTMEDDKQGRWARVAYIGSESIWDGEFLSTNFELAWIKKVQFTHIDGHNVSGFSVSCKFPSPKIKPIYDTLQEAAEDVEQQFDWFIKHVLK